MARMNYERARAQARVARHAYSGGIEYSSTIPASVSCVICSTNTGVGVRASIEPGVAEILGIDPPDQVWLCEGCAQECGPVVDVGFAEFLAQQQQSRVGTEDVEDAADDDGGRSLWKWALAVGAVVVVAGGVWANSRDAEQ